MVAVVGNSRAVSPRYACEEADPVTLDLRATYIYVGKKRLTSR